jgi:hypothetical protein
VLPWVVGAALAARRGGSLRPLLLWLAAAAAAGSTSALIATATALCVIGLRPAVRFGGVLGFAAAVNLPWIVPALARPGGVPADPAGVAAFAARSDTPLGLAGSLLTLGGIWNPATVPYGRDSALATVALVAVLVALVLGLRPVLADSRGLVAAGAGGLLLAAAGAVPGLDAVPAGGGGARARRWPAPGRAEATGAGRAGGRARGRARGRPAGQGAADGALGGALAVLPVLALPGLAWGVGGRLAAADYPADWLGLRAAVAQAPPGEVAALPWGTYRRLDWAGRPRRCSTRCRGCWTGARWPTTRCRCRR